ncbi:phytosulfokines 5-like isoform X2 [Vigna umbellata]|uniref:phytosulfokines 5-like isoform X2 n=1 Tax=Vigna umbellata TaxID=87088 RepID=UPI001F5F08D1|nr:phytosulfokines 5-like isoform X2 [Vigna umbellata]
MLVGANTTQLSLLFILCISQHPFLSLSLSFNTSNMKLNLLHLGALLFFLFFLVSSYARPLSTEQGWNRSKLNEVSGKEDFAMELEGGESLKLLGVEDCRDGDEECVQRRMTLEAHLDYIYTQHHKP